MFLITAAATVSPGESEAKTSGAVIHVRVSRGGGGEEEEDKSSSFWVASGCRRRESSAESSSRRIARSCPWLEGVPFIDRCDEASLERVAAAIAARYSGEFCWASCFDAEFVASLMSHGFLTMAQRVGRETYALLPKLHRYRCALRFEDRHTPRSVRRKARRFAVSRDRDFAAVVGGIARQHGDECWLYPPLVAALARLFEAQPSSSNVRVHTFECWRGDDLVAGELGYACGDVYTSLSGFSTLPSAGSVQCAATANWLRVSGYALWDLGMELPYKLAMGATNMPRADFLAVVKQARLRPPLPILAADAALLNARDVIDADRPSLFARDLASPTAPPDAALDR